MPSVHIVGQILGASGFTEDKLFCKYKVVYDHKSMTLIAGDSEDQTQLASASVRLFFYIFPRCNHLVVSSSGFLTFTFVSVSISFIFSGNWSLACLWAACRSSIWMHRTGRLA